MKQPIRDRYEKFAKRHSHVDTAKAIGTDPEKLRQFLSKASIGDEILLKLVPYMDRVDAEDLAAMMPQGVSDPSIEQDPIDRIAAGLNNAKQTLYDRNAPISARALVVRQSLDYISKHLLTPLEDQGDSEDQGVQ